MNEPERPETCQRCDEEFDDQSFVVRVDADPPMSAPVELWICEQCMESMTRWVARRPAKPSALDETELRPEAGLGGRKKRGRRSRVNRRARYADELDRHNYWVRNRWIVVTASALGAVLVVIAFSAAFAWTLPAIAEKLIRTRH
jgi:hypothetical protein